MLEEQLIAVPADDYESDPRSIHANGNDVSRELRREVREQALSCANRIEAPDALKTLSHRFDANVGK